MYISEAVKKAVFPLNLVWIAITSTIIIYGGLLLYLASVANITTKQDFSSLINVLLPLSYVPFIFTFIFHRKLNKLVRSTDKVILPTHTEFSEEDKKVLSYFNSYFVIHIILYAVNESGVLISFVLSKVTNDFSYYVYPALIALFLNTVVMRPNYFGFIKGKKIE